MGKVFCAFLTEVTWPWAPTQRAIFWLKFFSENQAIIRDFLDPWIGFLTFVEPKL